MFVHATKQKSCKGLKFHFNVTFNSLPNIRLFLHLYINIHTCNYKYYILLLAFSWREHFLKVRQQSFVAKLFRPYLWALNFTVTFHWLFFYIIKRIKIMHIFRYYTLHSLIITMDCLKIEFIATLLCVAMYASSADQQNSSNFLTNYARHQNICDKIGWEPKCGKGATGKEGNL